MPDIHAGFFKAMTIMGLLGIAMVYVMIWVSIYCATRRAYKEDPKQFRGWNNKSR